MAKRDRIYEPDLRKRRFAELLVGGYKPREAARQLGISERTAQRYCEDPAVVAYIRDLEQAALEAVSRRLRVAAEQAVAVLEQAMFEAPWPSRVKAAGEALSLLTRLHALVGIEQRLGELERLLDGRR